MGEFSVAACPPQADFPLVRAGQTTMDWFQPLSFKMKKPKNELELFCGEREIRTLGSSFPLRRFSKPLVSATHPSLR